MVDIPVLLKRSTTPGATPQAVDLQTGELAINAADGKLFFKNTSNVVTLLADAAQIGGGSGPDFSDFTGELTFDLTENNWIQLGNPLTVTNSVSTIEALDASTIVFTDNLSNQFRTYSWNGTDWAQVGNSFNIGASNSFNGIAALNSTTIAWVGDVTEQLRTYSWNGTNWSQVGNGLGVGTLSDPEIVKIDTNTIAIADRANDTLRTYSWNGTDWAQVGNTFNLQVVNQRINLGQIGTNKIAVFDSESELLRTYQWDGTDWAQVGNSLSIVGAGQSRIAGFGNDKIAFVDTTNDQLRTYSWDGTDWSLDAGSFNLPGISNPAITVLDDTHVAFIENASDQLKTFEFTAGSSRIIDPNTTGQLGALLSAGSRFRIAGSTSNDGLYTVTNVVNVNTIEVLSVTDEGPVEVSLMVDYGTDFDHAFTQNVDAGTNKITNLSDPTAAQDAATKNYVDSISGLVTPDFAGNLLFDIGSPSMQQIGNALTITSANQPTLTALDTTTVAYFDAGLDQLRTYSWDGTDWAQVGNGLAISVGGRAYIAALNSTTIAFIDDSNDELRTYSWNGTDWAQVGSGLSVPTILEAALVALDANSVAFIDSTQKDLRKYTWNGSTWSQVGNDLNIAGTNLPALAALDANTVAFFDEGANELRTYSFDGTDWAQVGNGLLISGTVFTALTALDSNTVVFANSGSNNLRTYNWDGTNWTLDLTLAVTAFSDYSALAAMSSGLFAFFDRTNDQLKTYEVVQTTYDIIDDDAGGTLGAIASPGDWIRISGTASNNGLKKISSIPDANTIRVESVTAEGPVAASLLVDKTEDLIQTTDDLPEGTSNFYATGNEVQGDGSITDMIKLTQAQYDALGTPDANTFYVIVG